MEGWWAFKKGVESWRALRERLWTSDLLIGKHRVLCSAETDCRVFDDARKGRIWYSRTES